jgi:hypothetical protein
MFRRVHATMLSALWATAIRDQVLKYNRLTTREIKWPKQEFDATSLFFTPNKFWYLRIILHNVYIVFFQIKLR